MPSSTEQYQAAIDRERAAWKALDACDPNDKQYPVLWNQWQDAVLATDKARTDMLGSMSRGHTRP